ncbi:cyclic nucleotide-binding domain-containing protein [Bdellovibrionota bacterium FG-2]
MNAPLKSDPQAGSRSVTHFDLGKGDLLFAEGEGSRSMYLLESGLIRLFKKKGDAFIELETVHPGQMFGELSFLDGQPRSSSAEALMNCKLSEISNELFQTTSRGMPEWFKHLLKAVVGRLRAADSRIKQLETASTAVHYDENLGKRITEYIFLSPLDVLKIAAGILLVAARSGKVASPESEGIHVAAGGLYRYVNQIMGVPVAKISALIEVLSENLVTTTKKDEKGNQIYLHDADFLERMTVYLNEENLANSSKRHDLSARGFRIMELIAHYVKSTPPQVNAETGKAPINVAEVRKLAITPESRDPFRMQEVAELIKLEYASNLNVKSSNEVTTEINVAHFLESYRIQKIVLSINALNEQKQSGGARH